MGETVFENSYNKISTKFMQRWNFPSGKGAVDGEDIVIQESKNFRSHYRNYKGTDTFARNDWPRIRVPMCRCWDE